MMAWLTRKNETLRRLLEEAREEKNIAEIKLKIILELHLKQLGESREVNEKLVKENLQYRSENTELRQANDEKAAKIEHLEKCMSIYQNTKKTSFQEDLEFFVNDCTEAQARELYERLKKRLCDGAYVKCDCGCKAYVGDTVEVTLSQAFTTLTGKHIWTGKVNRISMKDYTFEYFRLLTDSGCVIELWPNQFTSIILRARREEKK